MRKTGQQWPGKVVATLTEEELELFAELEEFGSGKTARRQAQALLNLRLPDTQVSAANVEALRTFLANREWGALCPRCDAVAMPSWQKDTAKDAGGTMRFHHPVKRRKPDGPKNQYALHSTCHWHIRLSLCERLHHRRKTRTK